MFYFRFTADTPYCGTENTNYRAFEVRPTDAELDEMVEEYGEDMMWAVLQHRVIKGMPITLVMRSLGYSPTNSYNTSSRSVLTYETLEHVTSIKNPLPVYQNGRIKISIYFDANNEVIGWSD